MNRVIIFDFDGVLADSLAPMLRYAGQVCNEMGVSSTPTQDDLEALEKMEFSEFGRQIGVPEDLLGEFVARNFELFANREEPLKIASGMETVVSGLAELGSLAIITGNSCRVVERFLNAYGMSQKFGTILCAEDPGSRLEKMRAVKDQYQPTGGEIFMIGDAVSDIRAAREAGVTSIAVTWGHQSKSKLSKAEPDVLIDQPEDMLEFFSSRAGDYTA